MPNELPPADRITAVERRLDTLEPSIGEMKAQLAVVQSDVRHMVEGAGRVAASVERLTEKMTEKLIADGAAAALVSSDLTHLKTGLATLNTAKAARQWPASAKAGLMASLAAAAAQAISSLAGAPLVH